MTRAAINCESCDFTCRSKPSLLKHKTLVHTSQNVPKEPAFKKRKIPMVTCTECHSTFTSKSKLKKHVNEEHKNEERQEILKESPPRKESKTEDLNVRISIEHEQDTNAMEETQIEDKETKEARKIEEELDLKRRLFDQNKKMFRLEQERDMLVRENKDIKDKAKSDVKDLEEYIQQ